VDNSHCSDNNNNSLSIKTKWSLEINGTTTKRILWIYSFRFGITSVRILFQDADTNVTILFHKWDFSVVDFHKYNHDISNGG